MNRLERVGIASALCLLLAPAAWAQVLGGVQGVVRDTSGAVLPGVTVEAASPALIEKVRAVVTDGEGRYNIVALQPGTYTVTFSLAGFNTIKREGIVLTGGFTAPLNVEMRVGALEETITVTGEAPLVDTQNIRRQTTVITQELLETLPSGSMGGSVLLSMTPGLTSGSGSADGVYSDLGGTAGFRQGQGGNARNEFRGRAGIRYNIDGMGILSPYGQGVFSYVPNPLLMGEITIESGGTAESSGNGLSINQLPKEGGNTFTFMSMGLFSNTAMQSDNLTDELIQLGLRDPGKVNFHWDVGQTIGGPIKRDKAWFFAAVHYQRTQRFETDNYYNATQGTPLYTPDLSRPAHTDDLQRAQAGRITWQISPRNKLNGLLDVQNNWSYRQEGPTTAPEAKTRWHFYPGTVAQTTWTSPVTNRLLLEAAAGVMVGHWPAHIQPEVGPNDVGTTELSTGLNYGGPGVQGPTSPARDQRNTQRASLSYVTGTHSLKVGMTIEQMFGDYGSGIVPDGRPAVVDVRYQFLNERPLRITQTSRPYVSSARVSPDLAIYAQDQWAINRLTLNYGLRFDYFNGYVPEQQVAATRFVPERHFERVDGIPKWKDFSPRLGAAYDLFGSGRTALKVSFGRYIAREGVGIPLSLNPITTSVNSVTRTWTDTNNDFVPDCDLAVFTANGECGQISDLNFGKSNITTRWSDEVLKGFGARPAQWDIAAEVQQQLGSGISVSGGYDRSWDTNFRVTDNLLVEPSDYDPFCITAPRHPDLPNGGGYQVCGLYDIKPAKFGVVNNLVRPASDFGDQKRISDFFHATIDTRFRNGVLIRGGIDTGRIIRDNCLVVDSPQDLLYCRAEPAFSARTQIKLQGSYPLPGDVVVAAIFQNTPQGLPYQANYTARNAEIAPSLGRNLGQCRGAAVCNAGVTVPLISPHIHFEKRRTQLDLRFSKMFRLNDRVRLQANVDMYNALNSATGLATNNTFGPKWRYPTAILGARLLQVGARLTY